MIQPIPSPDDHGAYREWCDANGQRYLPGFVTRMPEIAAAVLLPCCSRIVAEPDVPVSDGTCSACGDEFFVRRCPDGVTRILTTSAMIEVECLDAEQHVEDTAIVVSVNANAADTRESLLAVRKIARGRVLAKHGRCPWPDGGSGIS